MKFLLALVLATMPVFAHAQAVEGCSIDMPAHLQLPTVSFEERTATTHHYLDVECEAGLAYQVEVSNAHAGGVVELTSTGPTTIPLFLRQSDTRQPWGASNQGEARGGVGTGARVSYPVEIGVSLEVMPPPGIYQGGLQINLIF